MGHREDLVRQRMADEERHRQDKADMKARTDAAELVQLNQEYDELIAAFDKEGKRIAKQLTDVDWSKGELRTFTPKKKHWWSRKHPQEYAVYMFASYLEGCSGWLRSDDWLFLAAGNGRLRRPSGHFERSQDVSTMKSLVAKMRSTLESLTSKKLAA